MNQNEIIEKLNEIFKASLELKGVAEGDPALEGDVDRILAISREKLILLDPENFIKYRREGGK